MLKKNLTILVTLLTGTAVCSNGDTLVATFYYAEEDFQFSDEEGGGETFDFVELPGELHFMNPGEPMMPLVNAAFAVPWGSTVNAISITASASEVLDGGYYVYPAQEQAEIGEGDVGWTPPNPAIYGSSNPYPAEVVQGGAAGTARGHMLYNFAFAPMQYRPADGWGACSGTGQVLHYNGSSWTVSLSISGWEPYWVSFFDRSNGWAVYGNGKDPMRLFKFGPVTWREVEPPDKDGVGTPCSVSRTEGWFTSIEKGKYIAWRWYTEPSVKPASLGEIKTLFK
jgi:hypothetical protein